jgi:hypothetical protein
LTGINPPDLTLIRNSNQNRSEFDDEKDRPRTSYCSNLVVVIGDLLYGGEPACRPAECVVPLPTSDVAVLRTTAAPIFPRSRNSGALNPRRPRERSESRTRLVGHEGRPLVLQTQTGRTREKGSQLGVPAGDPKPSRLLATLKATLSFR